MKIPIWVKILITSILMLLIIWKIGTDKLALNIKGIDLQYFLYALLLSPLIVLLGTEKWYQISKHKVKDPSRSSFLISFLGGMSMGLLTPARVGEFSRVLYLDTSSKTELTGIAFLDKVIDLEITLLLALCSVFILFNNYIFLALLLVGLLGLFFLYYPKPFIFVLTYLTNILPIKQQINLFLEGIHCVSPRKITECLFYRLVVSLIDLLQFYMLIMAFSSVTLSATLAAYPLIMLANILPITIGGIGIREGISAIILVRFKVSPEVAVSASFLLFCVNTLLPGLVGTLFVSRIKLATRTIHSQTSTE